MRSPSFFAAESEVMQAAIERARQDFLGMGRATFEYVQWDDGTKTIASYNPVVEISIRIALAHMVATGAINHYTEGPEDPTGGRVHRQLYPQGATTAYFTGPTHTIVWLAGHLGSIEPLVPMIKISEERRALIFAYPYERPVRNILGDSLFRVRVRYNESSAEEVASQLVSGNADS